MGTIYGLIDPISKELRYIGQTITKINRRYNHHIYNAKKSNNNSHIYNWLRQLVNKNLLPELLIIEDNCQNTDEMEIFYISYFRYIGCNLTNHSIGGKSRGGFSHTEAHKNKMSLLFKGRHPWNFGLKLTDSQKKNRITPIEFLNQSEEVRKSKAIKQSITKSKNSKVCWSVIEFIRENKHNYKQRELAAMFNLRQDYISDIINFKIRKYA